MTSTDHEAALRAAKSVLAPHVSFMNDMSHASFAEFITAICKRLEVLEDAAAAKTQEPRSKDAKQMLQIIELMEKVKHIDGPWHFDGKTMTLAQLVKRLVLHLSELEVSRLRSVHEASVGRGIWYPLLQEKVDRYQSVIEALKNDHQVQILEARVILEQNKRALAHDQQLRRTFERNTIDCTFALKNGLLELKEEYAALRQDIEAQLNDLRPGDDVDIDSEASQ